MSDFWARRKAAVAKEVEAEEVALSKQQLVEAEATLAERSDEELLEEAKLPAPEALESAEAVREFMSSALPQRLKTRALRQLWKLNPVLANLDGLVDYGEDFTDAATVIENLQTAYQVGKGMLSHLEAMAEQESDAADDSTEPDLDAEDVEVEETPEPLVMAEQEPREPPVQNDAVEPDFEDVPVLAPSRRRMQFEFETQV